MPSSAGTAAGDGKTSPDKGDTGAASERLEVDFAYKGLNGTGSPEVLELALLARSKDDRPDCPKVVAQRVLGIWAFAAIAKYRSVRHDLEI
jgi:hypothetical protein